MVKNREARASLDKAVININREMERKLQEFGYFENGQMVKPYRIASLDLIEEDGRS